MADDRIFPSELAMVLASILLVPLFAAGAFQAWFLLVRGLGALKTALWSIATAALSAFIVCVFFFSGLGPPLSRLGLFPLAFLVVTLVTPIISWLAMHTNARA